MKPKEKRCNGRRIQDKKFIKISFFASGIYIGNYFTVKFPGKDVLEISTELFAWIAGIANLFGGAALLVSIGTFIFSVYKWKKGR